MNNRIRHGGVMYKKSTKHVMYNMMTVINTVLCYTGNFLR